MSNRNMESQIKELLELKRMREEEGPLAVIEKVCKLDPNGTLAKLIMEKIELLKNRGWIHA